MLYSNTNRKMKLGPQQNENHPERNERGLLSDTARQSLQMFKQAR